MKKLSALPLLAVAAACAPVEPAQLSAGGQSELATALRGLTQGQPVACVSQRNLRSNRSIGEGVILFESVGNTVYVNRPPAACPLLRDGLTLVTNTPAGRLCRGDIVSVVDLTTNVERGTCALGDFTPYRRAL